MGEMRMTDKDSKIPHLSFTTSAPQSFNAICAWIPLFPLRCEELRKSEFGLKPTALIDLNDSRKLWQVSPQARHFGVRSGMTINQAIGLCHTLTLFEPDPVFYDDIYSQLLLVLEKFSPVIEPSELGRIYIGVDGLDRLIGGAESQLRAITKLSSQFGVSKSMRLGWGRGKFMSWVAAMRSRPGAPVIVTDELHSSFLLKQPVSTLPIHSDTHRRLLQLGIRTLGDIARLPEPAVISQFGREGRDAWRLATGAICIPVTGRVRPEPITCDVDFPGPVADLRIMGNAIARLFDRALQDPRRTGWRVRSIRITAALENGGSWSLTTPLKTPTANHHDLMEVVRMRVGQSPPAGGIVHIKVALLEFSPGTTELQLFARDEASAARAGRRKALRWATKEIQTRLHRSLLYHIVEVNPCSRIPERRYALIDYEA